MQRLIPILGILVFCAIAWAFAPRRSRIPWSTAAWAIALQLLFVFLVLGVPALGIDGPLAFLFTAIDAGVTKLLSFSDQGANFVFGPLMDPVKSNGFIFAFKVLPTIIFFSALVTLLYHWGLLQKVVQGMAWVMQRSMKISGAEALSTAANVFLGQTEAPLVVKPYLPRVTRSELFCIMVGGMASVAGGVLAAFVGILGGLVPNIAGHLVAASVMSAPATILIAKLMIPETETPETSGEVRMHVEELDANAVEAISRGATEGLALALNVAAMLLVFISFIALLNACIAGVGSWVGFENLSMEHILGYVLAPVAWLMGVPGEETRLVGSLLGQKVVLNEFIAYVQMSQQKDLLSPRTLILVSYALCGFANFSSIGIQIGGIGAMAPSRRSEIARLGVKAVIGGNLATFVMACLVSLVL
jgi:CNT family concentrative nucleoside transporter